MTPVIATSFPIAGVWLYLFMGAVAIILIPIFPFILRRRRNRAQAELHDKIQKATAQILKDGIVEGPKGDYVPHQRRGAPTQTGNTTRWKGPYGPAT